VSRADRRRGGAIGTCLALCLALLLAALAAALQASCAAAALPRAHWSIVSESQPTRFVAGAPSDAYVVVVRNDGAAATSEEPVSLTDTLPAGVAVQNVNAVGESADGKGEPRVDMDCPEEPTGNTVTCTYGEEGEPPVLPGAVLVLTVVVSVAEGITALGASTATISGGGAPSASSSDTVTIGSSPAPFGLSLFELASVGEAGEPDTQAGSHPFELTSTLAFTVAGRESVESESPLALAAPKDLDISLPPGLLGNAAAIPRCSQQTFMEMERPNCPLDTQVGTIKAFFYGSFHSHVFPVYNLVALPGEPAELGFSIGTGRVPLFLGVRGNGEYGLTASLEDIPEAGPLQGAILTLWGVPAASSHDIEREGTQGEGGLPSESCAPKLVAGVLEGCPSGAQEAPFLTLPSRCQGSKLAVGVEYDSWEHPVTPLEAFPGEAVVPAVLTGCEALSFSPSLTLTPESTQAGAPSGYTLDLHVPQDEDPRALATPALRTASVSLPAGVVLSPSVANGLQACSADQFEAKSSAPATCPPHSQIGTVTIVTPLLGSPLEGQIFLGEPACSPCGAADAQEGRLLRLLVQAQGSGVTVKLAGSVSIDQATGQLTASLEESPELPFEDVKLTFAGGAGAALANPSSCGSPLRASSRLTPYSSETPAEPSSEPFTLSGCPPPRFQPSFVAGTTDNQAGAYSPLTVTLSRTDQDEDLQSLSVRLAPGLLGMLSHVAPCPQAQARAGTCAAQSLLGTATIGAGPGPDPLFLRGSVYLTGPYEGAPYGLSIVVPVAAGPLDLGSIVLGARIAVDPLTAAFTITSDPLPQSIDGIPLQMRTLNLDIDREGFIRNPTDCRALAIEGALTSAAGASAAVSSPFQAANCRALAFRPQLSALAHAQTSRAAGAYLHVRFVSGPGQADIAALKVDLPRRLSVRLGTLQRACAADVVEADPSACPPAAVVGSASVISPALTYPLIGSAYLVSHGGGAFPGLAIVLRGNGLTVRIEGQTSVTRGVTSAAFRALPDVPISRFDLKLRRGPHSLLAANLEAGAHGSLCGARMRMPSEITGQNGAVVKQTIEVGVSGCPRPGHGRARRRKA
jgi:uncharacterized repeat protein (TIGR01451 family)